MTTPKTKKKPTTLPTKRIFIFADGTGNSASSVQKTNVWRMFQALDKNSGKEIKQLSFYDGGVGTSNFTPSRILGQVFGIGLKRNVLDAYSFLCTHYEPGAEIYLFGFSRGAFTIRMLAALIGKEGLLCVGFSDDPNKLDVDPAKLDTYALTAYRSLSESFPTNGNKVLEIARKIRGYISDTYYASDLTIPYGNLNRHLTSPSDASQQGVTITFMGLFDTVSAYGGPVNELTAAFNWLFWPAQPKDWLVGKYVKKVCHALALDEPRHSFSPKLITETIADDWTDPTKAPKTEAGNRIEQVWFAGAHANVGGGYANDGLSMIPLNWMISKLKKDYKIAFIEDKVREYEAGKDSCAPLHDPRAGIWGIYRYSPRDLNRLTMDMNNGIYIETPKIHHTVFERIIENPGYAPTALNRPYKIVDDKGTFVKDSQIGKMVPDFEESAHVGTQQNPLDTLGRFNPYLENAWDKVWWKRLVYFTHLTFLSCLLAGPWILDFVNITNDETKSCKDRICSLTEPLNALQSGIEEFLPFGMNIEPWIKTAQQYQGWTIFFALVWGVLFWLGERQKTLVNTTLAHYWLGLAGVEDKPKKVPEKSNLYKIRTSNKYRYCFDVLKRYCMTWLWAIAIIVGLVLAVNKTGVFLRDHTVQSLALCPAPSNKYESAKIDISKVCNDTLANVIEGATYQIRVEPDEGCRIDQDNEAEPWRTAGVAASPSGVNKDKVYLLSRLWRKPLQRTNSVRLFSPILQIGSRYPTETIVHFNEAYSSSYNKAFWISRFTAPQTGRAYFYANDSIISALPSSLQFIQKRNCGTGQITIKPI